MDMTKMRPAFQKEKAYILKKFSKIQICLIKKTKKNIALKICDYI